MKNLSGSLCLVGVLAMSAVLRADECTGQANGTPCTSDGMDCTDDVCWTETCAHLPSPNGTPCTDDGLECTLDVCASSLCTHELRPAGAPCGDNSNTTCTNPDLCDEAGTCLTNHAPSGMPCEDGQFCTKLDACHDGVCVGGSPKCLPGEICDEAAELCIECTIAADCDDGNPCTADACSSNQCNYDPITGIACGSGVDDDCTNPDACDLFGDCQSNDEFDGMPCDTGDGPGQCRGGLCGAPDFATEAMPEDGLIGSDLEGTFVMEVAGPNRRASALRATSPWYGAGFTPDGVPHAALWEEQSDGSYLLTLLDKQMPGSRAHAGVCYGAGTCVVAGHLDNQPAAWVYDGLEWIAEDPGLPPGSTGGIILDGGGQRVMLDRVGRRGGIPPGTRLFVGFAYDSDDRIHAMFWDWDLDNVDVWNNAMLPRLGPNTQSRASAVYFHVPMDVWLVGGAAEPPQGHMRPAVWEEMTPGMLDFDEPILLPLLPGVVSGEVVALGAGQNEEFAVGNVTTAGGTSNALLWQCGSGFTGCSTTLLPPLPGQANARVTGLAVFDVFFLTITGTSYTTDRLTDGRATMWRVDMDTGDLLGTIDANNLVDVGPNGRLVSLADDYGTCFAGNCQTAGVVVEDIDTGPIASAVGNPHVYAIRTAPGAPIPAVSQWGLAVLTLLTLTAGTVALRRRRPGTLLPADAPNCHVPSRVSNERRVW